MGWGRSGTTLLEAMLNELPGCSSFGEVRYLWDRGMLENSLCGCGQPFSDCEMWQSVVTSIDDSSPEDMLSWRSRLRNRLLIPSLRKRIASDFSPYVDVLSYLYQSIHDASGATLIVDSSKDPVYGFLLSTVVDVDVTIVHLIRDPRAVAFSWQRKKALTDHANRPYMRQMSPLQSTIRWIQFNTLIHLVCANPGTKCIKLHYEDVVCHPTEALGKISQFIGLDDSPIQQIVGEDGDQLWFHKRTTYHSVAGNPIRMDAGDIPLRLDNEWQTSLRKQVYIMITLLTLPFLWVYKYSL